MAYLLKFGIHYIWLAHKLQNPTWSGVSWNLIKFEIKSECEKEENKH